MQRTSRNTDRQALLSRLHDKAVLVRGRDRSFNEFGKRFISSHEVSTTTRAGVPNAAGALGWWMRVGRFADRSTC